MAQKVYGPASEKQRLVLTAKEDIVFVGGAAGSGKALAHGVYRDWETHRILLLSECPYSRHLR